MDVDVGDGRRKQVGDFGLGKPRAPVFRPQLDMGFAVFGLVEDQLIHTAIIERSLPGQFNLTTEPILS